ncbi:hypothetical protein [Nevskia sp.]|uniref:hypothetical protein n=1 Tax=Nevskia sp. TaxID=1929292 RepID=UPI0025F9FE31|nr:hypothetical protein [Nevskia sp.]
MSLFDHIRQLAVTRWMRVAAVAVLLMCTVTWVAQTVSAVDDGDLAVALAAVDEARDAAAAGCGCDEADCDSVPLVALDETHDVKLFFLREFTHLLQPVVARMPRNRDLAAILRMSSETFRPPDRLIGHTGRSFAI